MPDEPSVMDGEIIEEMRNLEYMILLHKKVTEKGQESPLFCPAEIDRTLDKRLASVSWESSSYDTARATYAEAWMIYYETVFGEECFYTIQEFASMFARSR